MLFIQGEPGKALSCCSIVPHLFISMAGSFFDTSKQLFKYKKTRERNLLGSVPALHFLFVLVWGISILPENVLPVNNQKICSTAKQSIFFAIYC